MQHIPSIDLVFQWACLKLNIENLKLDECDYLKWWADGNETEEGFDEYAESEIKRMKGEGK